MTDDLKLKWKSALEQIELLSPESRERLLDLIESLYTADKAGATDHQLLTIFSEYQRRVLEGGPDTH